MAPTNQELGVESLVAEGVRIAPTNQGLGVQGLVVAVLVVVGATTGQSVCRPGGRKMCSKPTQCTWR